MKTLFLFIFLQVSAFSQTVLVEAAQGGSVTFTPSGVVRTEPKNLTQKVGQKASTPTVKSVVMVPKDANNNIPQVFISKPPDTVKIKKYMLSTLNTREARMVFQGFLGVNDREDASSIEIVTHKKIKDFLMANKGNPNATIDLEMERSQLERFFNSRGFYESKEELQKKIREIESMERLIKQIDAQELVKGISVENSILKTLRRP